MPSGSAPRIAVVIPVRGRLTLLEETVASLRAQTLDRWEALLVDDGTGQHARAALRAVASRDHRIRLVDRGTAPPGASACRNRGLASTHAPLIAFLDSDDLLATDALAQRAKLLEQDPAADLLVRLGQVFVQRPGDLGSVPWNELDTGRDLIERFLAADTPWQTTGPTWRRAALQRVGPWDEAATTWQDWEFHLRALACGLTLRLDPTVDYHHRRGHRTSMRSRHDEAGALEARAAMFKRLLARLDACGARTPRRDELLAGLHLRFALKAAMLHGRQDGGASARAILRALAEAGILSDERWSEAEALVRKALAGRITRLDDPTAIARFPVLAEVCTSPGRRRARGQPEAAPSASATSIRRPSP